MKVAMDQFKEAKERKHRVALGQPTGRRYSGIEG